MNVAAQRRVGVTAAGVVTFVNLYAPQTLLPTFAEQFGIGLARASLMMTATLVAVAAVAPFVGGVSDALGRRRLILTACCALVLPVLLSAWAPSFGILVLGRFIEGLLLPFIFAVTVAYIADECEPTEAVRLTGAYAIGSIVGGFAGRFVAGWATELAGWRAAFLILAALTLVCALLILFCLPAEQRFKPVRGWRGSVAGFLDQLANPQVVATCAMGFCVLFSMVAAFTFATVYLAGPPFRLSPAELGSMFVVYLVGVVATPVASRLALRSGRLRAVQFAAGCAAAGLLLTLAPSFPLILLGLGLAAGGIFAEQVLSLGYVAMAARQARSTAVGLYVTCYYTGGALGSVVPAGVWRHFGWPGCVALIVAVQAAALLVVGRVWPRHAPLP